MFYSEFADDYEQIFPFSENLYSFIKTYVSEPASKILDIGCATGHYCGRFASDQFKPFGIDLDSEMITSAKHNYKNAEFQVLNLLEIGSLESIFELVYSTGNVMAHVPQNAFKPFLKSLKKKMTKNGIWIFQVINWDYILRQNEFDFPVIQSDSKIFHRRYSEISEKNLTFHTELKNLNNGITVFKDKVTMYPLASDKYLNIHEEEGFQLLGHFSDYGKKPFNSNQFSADIYVFRKEN